MRILKITLYCFAAYLISSPLQAQSISVNDTRNAIDLVNLLANNSPCIQLSNENVYGDSSGPGKNSYGSFTNNSPNFPFHSGVILSTWSSKNSEGPFVRNRNGGNNSRLGDADLNQVLGINSINATVLEFDFIPLTNNISFNYFFASNEYQDNYPCLYSDGFAFLIREKGSTDPYQNLAVIPNTTTVVSSTNIHPAIRFVDEMNNIKTCPASNESYFRQYNSNPGNNSPINFAGQTKVLNASANVVAGTTYSIKLVIADDQVDYYDSAVFIEAGSFNSNIDLGADRLLATNNAICFGDDHILDTKLSTSYGYKWYKDGVLLSSENNPSYTVKSPGIYKVEITLSPSVCVVNNGIKIEYTPETVLKNSSLVQCDIDLDDQSTFNLTQADIDIKNNNSGLGDITYYENLTDAQSDSNPILNSSNYTNQSNPQTLIAKMTNSYNCYNYAELTLELSNDIAPTRVAMITGVKTTNFAANSNIAIIEYEGISKYEFSIDGIYYQESPEFPNLAAGNYTAYANDKNGCGNSIPFPFTILDYPRFFTPNGDGFNDFWTIENLDLLPKATITIFDRYGKLLKQFDSSNLRWNGIYNGHLLPADDYWFNLIFEDGKNIKGHFSLKR